MKGIDTMDDAAADESLISVGSEDGGDQGSSSTASTDTSANTKSGTDSAADFGVAMAETRLLKFSKLLVVAVLLLAAAGCGTATYFFVKRGEENCFQATVSSIICQKSVTFETLQLTFLSCQIIQVR